MAQNDRHLTTEQLSALLDEQLSSEEQAQADTHLKTCARCQDELAGLRQTVTLLQALPQPTLPRSFTLSTSEATPVPLAVRRSQGAAQSVPRRSRATSVRAALRFVSAIAALLGLVFFLSGIVNMSFYRSLSSTPTSGGSSSSAQQQSATPSSKAEQNVKRATTPMPQTSVPPAQDENKAPPAPSSSPSTLPTILFFNLSTPEGRIGLGIILVILGVMGFVLFKQPRKRAT